MVSAPYGQASAPGVTTNLARSANLHGTGVIYTCSLTPGTCQGLTGDGNGDDRRLYDFDG